MFRLLTSSLSRCLPLTTLAALMVVVTAARALEERMETREQALWRLGVDRSLMESSLEPIKKHLIELDTLEKQRAANRDYEGALAVRKERQRLEAQLEQMDRQLLLIQTREQAMRAAAVPDKVPLPLDQAQLDGVTRQGGELSGWTQEGSSATWKLPSLPPGGYEVVIRYRCGPLEGGVLEVREARFSLSTQIETTLKGPQEKNLGTLKITDGGGTLTLSGRALLKGSLMDLLGLWLVPACR